MTVEVEEVTWVIVVTPPGKNTVLVCTQSGHLLFMLPMDVVVLTIVLVDVDTTRIVSVSMDVVQVVKVLVVVSVKTAAKSWHMTA